MKVKPAIGMESSKADKLSSLIPADKLAEFCKRWKISELALFGSVLGDKFKDESDVDILIVFASDADWSLLDHMKMQQEMEAFVHRKVDFISKHALERSRNLIRKREILETALTLFSEHEAAYAAG